ncbi:MAG: hypothetical protein LBL71_01180 [Endomicrobium sp.]|jgi:hypothetical protein|nr:hypothetical protein [Endomicrobium sp.]
MNKKLGASLLSLGLILGLSVPVQAWHLFPVREKIVEVQKTNYALTAVVGAVTLIVGLTAAIYSNTLTNKNRELQERNTVLKKLLDVRIAHLVMYMGRMESIRSEYNEEITKLKLQKERYENRIAELEWENQHVSIDFAAIKFKYGVLEESVNDLRQGVEARDEIIYTLRKSIK